MADRTIDELPELNSLSDDDVLPISTGSDTYKAKISTFKAVVSDIAKQANDNATSALDEAKTAKSDSDEAKNTSQKAIEKATSAETKADEAKTTADEAKTLAEETSEEISNIRELIDVSNKQVEKATELSASAKESAKSAENAAAIASNAAALASSSATVAADAQTKANQVEALLKEAMGNTVSDVFVSDDGEKLVIAFQDGTRKEIEYASSKGIAFDSGAIDEQGYLHLTLNGVDIENFTPFFIGSGGGGGSSAGGSSMIFAITSGMSCAVTDTAEYVPGKLNFVSTVIGTDPVVDTGPGTLQIYINDNLTKTISIAQGETDFQQLKLIPVSLLKPDSNKIKLTVTDSYGLSSTRTITVTKVSLNISWDIVGSTLKNTGNSLIINITPTGASGNLKTILVNVIGPNDYNETFTKSTIISGTSSVPITITNLVEGAYIVTANCSMVYNGETMNSNTLQAAIAQVGTNKNSVIASPFNQQKGTQFTTIPIPYRAVDGDNETAEVTLTAYDSNNNVKFSQTLIVDNSEQVWNYKPSSTGNNKLVISCGTAEWSHTINIEALSINAEEVTTNLDYKLDPSTISNLNDFELSDNFDMINGGLVTDEEGVQCIRIIKGDRLIIPYNMFGISADANGKEIKIIYKVENCTNINASAIECLSGNIGLSIKANNVDFSSSLTTVDLITCEEKKTELDINVTNKQNNRLITIWERGMPHKVSQYASSSDKFVQDNPVGITVGSDDCNVTLYLIRSYTRALSDSEILSNFIIDGKDGNEIVNRYNRNAIYSNGVDDLGNAVADISGSIYKDFVAENNINAHIFTISSDSFPKGKSSADYVSGTVDYELRSGGSARKFARPISMRYRLQGTSSMGYIDSAANVDIQFRENILWSDGHEQPLFMISDLSIPVNYINMKVNTASSEHINNIILAYWFNMYQPWLRPARVNNSSVRDTVEGDMCIFFYHNSGTSSVKAGSTFVEPGETILYALGNVNNSKKNNEVFGQDDEDDILCVELNNNIDDKCRFKLGNVTSADFGDDSAFGIRYISSTLTENGDTEEEAAAKLFAPFQQFIVDCDPRQATNSELESPITYKINKSGKTETFTHDTEAYRIAKFRNELSNYFVVETGQYHYLFTLFFCMVDNRSKNLFFGYSKKTGKWHLCFGYDFDTAIGIDNVGSLSMSYGYLDTDHIGHNENAGYVYNAADSAFFNLIRLAFPEENADLYLALETKGCWDMNAFLNMCETYQNKFCEALWIEDFKRKYINPLTINNDNSYLSMGQGPKKLQRENFAFFQAPFISSYFVSKFSKENQASFRSYGTVEKMVITPYSDMFVTFIGGNIIKQERAFAGVPVEIDISDYNANDTETYILNAPFIMDLGDLSPMKMKKCTFANFKRVKSIILGSNDSDYENMQLVTLDVSNCLGLEKLVIANCTSFGGEALDLSNNILLKCVDTRGTFITGVTFANGGRIEEAYLNTIKSITMKNLTRLKTLQFNTDELNSVIVENTSYVGLSDVLLAATKLQNVRAIDVSLSVTNSSLLKRLLNVKGWDADGNEVENTVISGSCFIVGISSTVLANMRSSYPDLEITYGELIPEYTVRFMVDDTVFDTQIVERGGAAIKPTGTPTKESTVSTVYTFAGWGASFNNIIQDVDIPAVFEERVRTYTVTYMNGIIPVQTSIVEYNNSCKYEGEDLYVAGMLYAGWKDKDTDEFSAIGSVNNVERDVILNAHFVQPLLPPQKITDYDYLASEDPNDYIADDEGHIAAAYSLEQIYAICSQGLAKDYFTLKDRIKLIPISKSVIKDDNIDFMLADFNHCRLSSNEEYVANTVWQTVGVLNTTRPMNGSNTNVGGANKSLLYAWFDGTFLNQLSPLARSIIQGVKRKALIGDQSVETEWAVRKIWLPTVTEVGLGASVPYINEVDELSEHRTFPIYPDSNSRIKKTFNGQGSAVTWWLSSPYATSSSQFCGVSGNGSLYNINAYNAYSLAPCFCI